MKRGQLIDMPLILDIMQHFIVYRNFYGTHLYSKCTHEILYTGNSARSYDNFRACPIAGVVHPCHKSNFQHPNSHGLQ